MFTVTTAFRTEYQGQGQYDHFPAEPLLFRAHAQFENEAAQAEAFARFPKSVGIKKGSLSLYMDVFFKANGTTGEINEGGIKRVRKFLELAGPVEVRDNAVNAYKTLEDFLAALPA